MTFETAAANPSAAGKASAANEKLSGQLAKRYPKYPARDGSDSSDTISPPHRGKFAGTDTSETFMSITHEIWLRCKTDYLTGKGSLAAVAGQHGLKRGSVEKRAKREGWTRLRSEFEAAQLAKLFPPASVVQPLAPVAPDGSVSDQWLQSRMEIYYRRNTELLDKARKLLETKLDDESNLATDGLAKLTSALGGIVDAENKLLGLNHRQKVKPRRRPNFASTDATSEPILTPTNAG